MIPSVNIWSICFRRFLAMSMLMLGAFGCELKEEPTKEIYKARPEDKLPSPRKDEIPVKETPKTDSLTVPVDSMQKMMKDTTESLQHIEKKPEVKSTRKKYYYLTIHRKPLIT